MTNQNASLLAMDHRVPLISPLVGRHRELTLIGNQYKAAKDGSARVVLLVGELGIGKTRLLDEVARQIIKDGAIVLRGVASEFEGMPPYLPFLEALGEYIHATPPDVLRAQIVLAPQILLSVFPELAVHIGERPAEYPLPPEQTRLRLYEAIGTFLEIISVLHPLVLMLDDLHWADSASLDLLCYILRHHPAAKLLILGTCRAGENDQNVALEQAVNDIIRQRALTRVVMNPLSEDEIKTLAVNYLGDPINQNISLSLIAQCEGNPFFAEEILQRWVEIGALAQRNRRWVAVGPLEHTLPQSIVGALHQRFARLSTVVIDHLRVATIIGRTFDISLLAAVEGQEVEFIEEILLEAVHAQLLRTERTDVFTFSHNKIRETLHAEVSACRCRRLHGTIGQILEAQYKWGEAHSIFLLAELAFHFSQGGDRERGEKYSLLAAEAEKLYMTCDDISNVLRSTEQALTLAEANGDLGEAAECCSYLACVYCCMAEIRHSYEVNQRGMKFVESYGYPYQLRYTYSWSAFIFSSQGEWEEAALAIEQAQSLVDRLSSPAALAFLYQVRGFLAYQREDFASAESELRAASECQPGGPGELIYIGLLGLTQGALRKSEEMSASMAKLEKLLVELPASTMLTASILMCLALMAMALGDQERVKNLYPRLLAFRGQYYWFLIDRVLGEIAAYSGKWEEVMLHLSAAETTAKRERLRPELARTLVAQANFHIVCRERQSIPQATSLLKQALVLFEELGLFDAVKHVQQQLRKSSSRSDNPTYLSLPVGLTRSEAKVLQLVVGGKSNRLIAKELGLSEKTVANHLSHIFVKTTSENRAAAAVFAIRHGLA